MSKLETLAETKKQMNTLREQVSKQVKDIFYDAAKELFTENPNLKSIEFRCYTPYFNDGDECRYRSTHEYSDINGVGEYGDDREDTDAWDALGEVEQTKLNNAINNFMSHWDKNDMKELFGDHVKVKITKDGIDVSHYEHD